MSEIHAEIKDACNGIEIKLDEIAVDIREVPFNYKIVDKYTNIDEEVQEIYEWYDRHKQLLTDYENYKKEHSLIIQRIYDLEKRVRFLNHDVQNNKNNKVPITRHGGSFSQLSLE
jgi:hypothetical protein|tara:strand:- start:3064 stop:3408 length:345 start_codon:yes stop_codon:yes gene_type:complete